MEKSTAQRMKIPTRGTRLILHSREYCNIEAVCILVNMVKHFAADMLLCKDSPPEGPYSFSNDRIFA